METYTIDFLENNFSLKNSSTKPIFTENFITLEKRGKQNLRKSITCDSFVKTQSGLHV